MLVPDTPPHLPFSVVLSTVISACLLQELSLAGNHLTHLPEDIGRLADLQKLQLSGNYLESLPDSLCDLTALEVTLSAIFDQS